MARIEGWRKVNRHFFWKKDYGSVERTGRGEWMASRSGYQGHILYPALGPFPSSAAAMQALEDAIGGRRS